MQRLHTATTTFLMVLMLAHAARAWASPSHRNEPGGLLIVAPDAMIVALKPYAEARTRDLPTTLIPLSTMLANGDQAQIEGVMQPALDDAERLKRALFVQWKTEGIAFVLLVGDADVMPVRYMCLDRVHAPAFDYAFYPSDLYYADLAKPDGTFDDWNAQRQGFHERYFGEVRGEKNKHDPINFDNVDYTPEIAVGRWPVSDPAQATAVAAKVMRHLNALEREASRGDRSPQAALIACGGWIENRPMMDAIGESLDAGGWAIDKRYFADERRNDGTLPVDADQVIALINSGCEVIIHSGHGNDDRWEHSIDLRSIQQITGLDDRLPVMMSAGCSTARLATLPPYEAYVDADGVVHAGTNNGQVFTQPPPPPACYQRGEHNPTGLGEELLRSPQGGAVAYIGCNTGSQPCGMTLARGFADAIAQRQGDQRRIGLCLNDAIRHYIAAERLMQLKPIDGQWYPASIFFQGMKFMLFGDPSLPLGSD